MTPLDQRRARLARLVAALVNGGPMEVVVAQIKGEKEPKRTLTAEYEALDAASDSPTLDCETIVQDLRVGQPTFRLS